MSSTPLSTKVHQSVSRRIQIRKVGRTRVTELLDSCQLGRRGQSVTKILQYFIY
jgi:hypothetical protein